MEDADQLDRMTHATTSASKDNHDEDMAGDTEAMKEKIELAELDMQSQSEQVELDREEEVAAWLQCQADEANQRQDQSRGSKPG